jgi:hypothetical protein
MVVGGGKKAEVILVFNYVIKHYAIKAFGGVEVLAQPLFTRWR